ncbi:MAG: glutamate racemase [Plectolyngbya sp. WJT66-NPBG17]|jgi:glutamate racemase|nr:glutamate racemase [Plectolyngbya sp. WJT66-NPBG17]
MKNLAENFGCSRSGTPNGSDPIGLFDSGVGGLTVLREMYRQLPNESLLYFGDTARLPYGTRSQSEIIQFVREILHWMVERRAKMVIMACNTSSALAIETVRQEFPGLPILGVILPGASAAARQGKRIGVISTPATAASDAYRQAILEVDSTAEVWQIGCPEFVPLIEQGRIDDPYTYKVAQTYLQPLLDQNIDTLIYGCTHYPHLAPVLKSIVPSSVQFIDPAVSVAKAASQELEILGLRNLQSPLPTQFYVSGDPQPFVEVARKWLGHHTIVQQVALSESVAVG